MTKARELGTADAAMGKGGVVTPPIYSDQTITQLPKFIILKRSGKRLNCKRFP